MYCLKAYFAFLLPNNDADTVELIARFIYLSP